VREIYKRFGVQPVLARPPRILRRNHRRRIDQNTIEIEENRAREQTRHIIDLNRELETHNRFAARYKYPVTLTFQLRKATPSDVPRLRQIIEASVRGLQADFYNPLQIEGALRSVYGVDSQLIADGTYFAVEDRSAGADVLVACGGWSKRHTLYGGDQYHGREDSLLNPAHDAAKIRAFFVHPDWARQGIGGMILQACENAARSAGFTRLEMGATLSGVAFYRAKGYSLAEEQQVPLGNGATLPIVRMTKVID
jgi:GNAT superfamily N-acetyltransferase